MAKTTFTVEALQAAINEVILINKMFPELPIKLNFSDHSSFWSESTFPLTFKKIGNDEDVTLYLEDYFDGQEGGDHSMCCVLYVGFGADKRYFLKTGLYDSWDNGNDDYQWDGEITEVVSKEVKKIEWVAK